MSGYLRGQVFAGGSPAAGAHVTVFQFPPRVSQGPLKSDVQRSTTTDADGHFQVDGLRAGAANVCVRMKDFLLGCAVVEGPDAAPVVIELERGASILGRLDGVAAKRVRVQLESSLGMWEVEVAGTPEFDFDGLPSGLYEIRVEAEDIELVEPREIRVGSQSSHDLTLKLRAR